MLSKSSIVAGCLFASCLFFAVESFAAAPLDSVTTGYSSLGRDING